MTDFEFKSDGNGEYGDIYYKDTHIGQINCNDTIGNLITEWLDQYKEKLYFTLNN